MAEREGHPITFGAFLRYGVPVTIGTVLISTVYLWVRYLL
jgi:Na+/H+ antiporter NhaD/arsenite permease-like protein